MISAILSLLARLWRGALSRWRNAYYRALGVRIRGYVWMQEIEIPHDHRGIELNDGVALDRGVVLLCFNAGVGETRIRIGANTYLNRNTFVDAIDSVTIGEKCAFGPGCYITDHDHGPDSARAPLDQPMVSKPTAIEDGAWIGANVTILKGVRVGAGAVVGAGSVVVSDIPPRSVAVGVPARVVKDRLPTDWDKNQRT